VFLTRPFFLRHTFFFSKIPIFARNHLKGGFSTSKVAQYQLEGEIQREHEKPPEISLLSGVCLLLL